MYFEIVPVIILFAPLKLLGITICGPQATQIFSAFAVVGIFLLFYKIAKKFAPTMSVAIYLSISSAVTGISLWYAIKYPALYCTAITSGICLAIWGFYFCFKAFCLDDSHKKTIRDAFLGALFSSLVFGCRPTIGIISLSYIPMILYFLNKSIKLSDGNLKEKIKNWLSQVFVKQNIQVFIAFYIPYIIVAILLMLYNYSRFDNLFEFSQSYQLTGFDQHTYMTENSLSFDKIINSFYQHFLTHGNIKTTFPYITHNGVFVNFPILLLIFCNFNIFNKRNAKRDIHIKNLALYLLLTVIIICLLHMSWAPTIESRYTLDFNFILGILLMLSTCKIVNEYEEENISKISFKITLLATYTIIICFLLFFVAFDLSLVEVNPNIIPTITKFLMIK